MMKSVKTEKDGRYSLCSYDLDKCYCPEGCLPGAVILYAMVSGSCISVERILVERWGDIHGGTVRDEYSRGLFIRRFPNLHGFSREYGHPDAGPWMAFLEDGTTVSGGAGTLVNVRAVDGAPDPTGSFIRVEDETYSLNVKG